MKPVLNPLNLTTAALFALAAWRLGLSPELPAVLAFIFGGVLLASSTGASSGSRPSSCTTRSPAWAPGCCSPPWPHGTGVPLATAVIGGWAFAGLFSAL